MTDPWPYVEAGTDSPSCTSATRGRSTPIPLRDWTIRRRPATRHTTISASRRDGLRQVRDPETKKLVADRSTVVYNSRITLGGIPEEAYRYQLGSRSAIEWILDRYQVKVDGGPKGLRDRQRPQRLVPRVGDPRYIIDLLARIVTVSLGR